MQFRILLKDQQLGSIFSLTVGIVCAIVLAICKGTAEQDFVHTIFMSIGLLLIVLFGPSLIQSILEPLFNKKPKNNAALLNEPVLFWVFFFGLILTGKYLPQDFNIGFPLLVSGIFIFVLNLILLPPVKFQKTVIFIFCGLVLGLWLSGAAFSDKHHSCLFLEKLALGEASMDTLFHSAYSNIVKTYGDFSIGIDGNIFTQYHAGSHWVYAQICKLLGIRSIYFYLVGFYVLIIPIIMKTMIMFTQHIANSWKNTTNSEDNSSTTGLYCLIFTLGCTGMVPLFLSHKLAIWTDIFFGESYGLSMALASLFGCMILILLDAAPRKQDLPLKIVIAIMGAVTVSLAFVCKFPIGALALLLAGYLFIRKKQFSNLPLILCLTLGGILSLAGYLTFRFPYQWEVSFFQFYTQYLGINWLIPHWILYIFWFWLLILLFMRRKNISSIRDFKDFVKSGETIPLEILALAVIWGVVASCLLNLAGGSVLFFYDPQYWLGILLVSSLYLYKQESSSAKSKLSISIVIIMLLINSGYAVYKLNSYYGKEVARLQQSKSSQKPFIVFINTLEKLSKLKRKYKKKTVIFIPQSCKNFWNGLPKLTIPFLIPSLTGISSLDGLPPNGVEGTLYYGYANFYYGVRPQKSQNTKKSHILLLAKAKGFHRVIWFADDGTYETWNCLTNEKIQNKI